METATTDWKNPSVTMSTDAVVGMMDGVSFFCFPPHFGRDPAYHHTETTVAPFLTSHLCICIFL